MKISYNWLKTLLNIDIAVEETAALLTASGLEVEGIEVFESVKGGLKGMVVGHVLECSKHPDADKLSLTRVDIGTGTPLAIVCGAPNVAAGQKVIVATVGAKLYPVSGEAFEIKKSKIRGSVSEGMLCAEDEIGLGSSHAGIMVLDDSATVGAPASAFFNIENDSVLEIGLTPNRGDAASHIGVARDLAAILNTRDKTNRYNVTVNGLQQLPDASGINHIDISIENKNSCGRYAGLVISGVKVKQSPEWLQNRLKAIGLKPINNIVDVTNFVMHELGQPLHAFDVNKIQGNKVVVRNATEGESFTTLDGVKRTLKADDLMIRNQHESMCIAGVFGGLTSGINDATNAVFLESAYFDAGAIRKSSKNHGLKTDASFRFERGTDPDIVLTAITRAANLIIELAEGNLSMNIVDVYPEKLEPFKVAFSYSNCNALIGKEIERSVIKNTILNLGLDIESEGSDGLLLRVPRYKSDVTREVDVIEEVMRVYGYNNIEVSKHITYTASNEIKNFDAALEEKTGRLLEGFGFTEMMNLSLSKDAYYEEQDVLVKVVNPLSNDLNVLRADMLNSGLETIAYNLNRKNCDLKLYEFGRTYHVNKQQENSYTEQKFLSLFISGDVFSENPYGLNQTSNLSVLKSVLLNLLHKCGITSHKSAELNSPNFEYGLTYQLNNKTLAEIGLVSRKKLKPFDISQPVFYASIHWETFVKAFSKQKTGYEEISKFPSVRRDLALLIDKSVRYQQIEELAFSTERKLLKEVNLFDIYEGEKLGNKKSYAVSFTLLNTEATLTDKQIDGVMQKLISGYKEKLGAEIR